MMGRHHGLISGTSGAAVALGMGITHTATATAMVAVLAAGSGLMPDLDHPDASPARAFGPIGRLGAHAVGAAAGGHRKGTHNLWALAGISVLSWFLWYSSTGRAVLAGAILCMAIWTIIPAPWGTRMFRHMAAWLAGAALGYWFVLHNIPHLAFVLAVGWGYFAHLFADTLTRGGVKWAWPMGPRVALPIAGTTGTLQEALVAWVLIIAALIACARLA